MTIISSIKNSLSWIGATGPYILNICSLFLFINKTVYLFFYIIGGIINLCINFGLKVLIKDPRPKEDIKLFELALVNGKRNHFDQYGMPSGHSQSVGFSLCYIFLTLQNTYISLFYAIVSLITLNQRFEYKNHSIPQIIVGFLLGLLIGYIFYKVSERIKKGKLKGKKDDDCLIQFNIV